MTRPTPSHAGTHRSRPTRTLRTEQLERRDLMTGIDVDFHSGAGRISIEGTNANDGVEVSIDPGGSSLPYDDRVVVKTRSCPELTTGICYPTYGDSSERDEYSFPMYTLGRSFFFRKSVHSLYFDGNAGRDYFENETSLPSTAHGGPGDDVMFGGTADDFMGGQDGVDFIWGGYGNDVIYGGEDGDFLYGDSGHDILVGGKGHDILSGGYGRDFMIGGKGKDNLHGGSADDIMIGADTNFSQHDTILKAMRDVWAGSGSYYSRVYKLRNQGVNQNGWGPAFIKLNYSTIVTDSHTDSLTGVTGWDWFWGTYGEPQDRSPSEYLN